MSEATEHSQRPAKRGRLARIVRSRDFARDILVTTLGVLIALGIGEVVEEIRWKLRIASTQTAIERELGLVHAVYLSELELQPCMARRIGELDELLAQARSTGRLPQIENIGFPPNFGGFGDSWDLATGTEIPLKMDSQAVLETATLWANEDIHETLVDRQRNAFDRLLILEDRAGPFSDGRLHEAERDLVEIKNVTASILFIARRDSEMLRQEGVRPMYGPGEPLDRKLLHRETRRRTICQPMNVDGAPYRLKGRPWSPRVALSPA
ncbi:hypothetical protein [Sphingomonas mesophila]|uniref:hypothetical protein n=1 Tax=Sphingomonas mesophila TaxID=2303576 RepID=UPI000E56B112|nr:hypothetical protein [Sphingomonas mesophila]